MVDQPTNQPTAIPWVLTWPKINIVAVRCTNWFTICICSSCAGSFRFLCDQMSFMQFPHKRDAMTQLFCRQTSCFPKWFMNQWDLIPTTSIITVLAMKPNICEFCLTGLNNNRKVNVLTYFLLLNCPCSLFIQFIFKTKSKSVLQISDLTLVWLPFFIRYHSNFLFYSPVSHKPWVLLCVTLAS